MKPADNARVHSGDDDVPDNCFSACLASMMELPVEAVPRFEEFMGQPVVWSIAHNWLGYYRVTLLKRPYAPDGFSLAAMEVEGLHGNDSKYHWCIVENGRVVFDPHVSISGRSDFKYYLQLVPC